MKKINYSKFALSLLLVSTALTGCETGIFSRDMSNSSSYKVEIARASQQKIDNALNDFISEQNNFLGQLEQAITDQEIQQTLTSDNLGKKLGVFTTDIQNFRKQQLPRVKNGSQKETVEKALNEIEATLTEISQKVIDPLKDGFTETSIENIQRKLDFFSSFSISPSVYGSYGPITYGAIDRFFQTKKRILEEQVQVINKMVNSNAIISYSQPYSKRGLSDRVAQLEKEKTIAIGIAVLALLASGISLLRKPKGIDHLYSRIYGEIYHKLNSQKLENIDRSIELKIEEYLNNTKILEGKITNHLLNIQKKANKTLNLNSENNSPNNLHPDEQKTVFDRSLFQWIETYNQNPNLLKIHEVSVTEESLGRSNLGDNHSILIAISRRGNYWILSGTDIDYLVPSASFRMNQYNYPSVESLFECRNYHPDEANHDRKFKLLKPALVSALDAGETWRLHDRGILEF